MRAFLCLTALLIASCHPQSPPTNPESIDEPLWNAVSRFEEKFQVSVDIKISIKDLSRFDEREGFPVYGRCAIFSSPRFVEIDFRALQHGYWFLEHTVFHELGHCVFSLPHVNEPFSIMRDGFDPDWASDYERDRERYIEHFRSLI